MKDVDAKVKDLEKFEFGTKDFNPYDPHCICKNHCAKVYYPWIYEACHWVEEDPWRYFYNSSRLSELVSMVEEWKATLQAVAPYEATTIMTVVSNKPMQYKGKRKIVKSAEAEKSYKLKEDTLVEKVALEIEAKR